MQKNLTEMADYFRASMPIDFRNRFGIEIRMLDPDSRPIEQANGPSYLSSERVDGIEYDKIQETFVRAYEDGFAAAMEYVRMSATAGVENAIIRE